MYETGAAVPVHAFHTMPGLPPPEGVRHGHDYRLEATVSRAALDEQGMVVDLDLLDAALRRLVDRLTGADLDEVCTPTDGPVTVERFARWLHRQLAASVGGHGGRLAVRVWESPTAFGGYAAPLPG